MDRHRTAIECDAIVEALAGLVARDGRGVASLHERSRHARRRHSAGRRFAAAQPRSGAVCRRRGTSQVAANKIGSPPAAVIVFEQSNPSPTSPDGSRAARRWQTARPSRCMRLSNGVTSRGSVSGSACNVCRAGCSDRPHCSRSCCWLVSLPRWSLIPAEFTVTGPGELWPDHRREVFASTSGIVDQILVAHGDEVKPGQPLLVLRDPELESETPRILGEIATVNERLKGVQASRLVGGTGPDAASRARQLTADEEELKERLRTLERQRQLIEERREALTLRSPIAGSVLTWEVAQHLSARPVERGQALLSIGETSGAWIVEVRVADKDAGHLLRARQALRQNSMWTSCSRQNRAARIAVRCGRCRSVPKPTIARTATCESSSRSIGTRLSSRVPAHSPAPHPLRTETAWLRLAARPDRRGPNETAVLN